MTHIRKEEIKLFSWIFDLAKRSQNKAFLVFNKKKMKHNKE